MPRISSFPIRVLRVIRGPNAFVLDARLKTAGERPAARNRLSCRVIKDCHSLPKSPEGRAANCPGRKAPAPSGPGDQLFFQSAFLPDRVFSEQGIVRIADLGQGAFGRIVGIFEKEFRGAPRRAGDFSVVVGPFFKPQKNQKNRSNHRLIGVPQGVGGGRGGRYTAGRPRFDLDT